MHSIKLVPEARRIDIILDRFDDHDNTLFMQDVQQAALNVSSGRPFDMLCDFSQSMVMPQDIADNSKELAEWLLANGLRKSANIMQSTTQRMQIARVTQRDKKFAYFSTCKEALAWLQEGQV